MGQHLDSTQRMAIDVVLPGGSLVVIVSVLMVMRWRHPYSTYDCSPWVWIARAVLIATMTTFVCLLGVLQHIYINAVLEACVFAITFLDNYGEYLQRPSIKIKTSSTSFTDGNSNQRSKNDTGMSMSARIAIDCTIEEDGVVERHSAMPEAQRLHKHSSKHAHTAAKVQVQSIQIKSKN